MVYTVKSKILFFLLLIVITAMMGYAFRDKILSLFFSPRKNNLAGKNTLDRIPTNSADIEILAENLEIPWDIAFLPNDEILITQRPGTLLFIGPKSKTVREIQGVHHVGEGGLLGLALHPLFTSNHYIYLYLTTSNDNKITNRVERYKLKNQMLTDRTTIIDGIAGSVVHDGGRLGFDKDGYLFITTGDAQKSDLAQDKTSLNGKILRIHDDGRIPSDNPFRNAVYSLGHRNPQGLAWDARGDLWSTEHGPSGLETGHDEINRIIKGANYGWPLVKGDETQEGFTPPVLHSGSDDTWAPSGMVFIRDTLLFAGLRGQSIYKTTIETKDTLTPVLPYFQETYGRIRTVSIGPDGYIYILTNNTDGRGDKKDGDDKIIKIHPKLLDL